MNSTILIIDDEPNIRRMMQISLEQACYNVLLASGAKEGLKAFGDGSSIDLVVLDYRMPEMNGIEVLKALVKIKPTVKTVMISGYGSIDMAIEAMTNGATDFLRKPFSPDSLRCTVKHAIEESVKDAPIASVCREFTKTNINGFNFEIADLVIDEQFGDVTMFFEVLKDNNAPRKVKVILPAYMQELILAYIDADFPPCGQRLWEATCEEKLASHLWEFGEIPRSGQILIEDLSDNMKTWLNSILTVSVAN